MDFHIYLLKSNLDQEMTPVSQMATADSEALQDCYILSEKLGPTGGAKEIVDQEELDFLLETITGEHYYYYGHFYCIPPYETNMFEMFKEMRVVIVTITAMRFYPTRTNPIKGSSQ